MGTEYTPLVMPGCEALVDERVPDEERTGETAVDWSTGEVFRVHPTAAMFPMLDSEALAELATDIQANTLRMPVILNKERVLLDGRNRLAACAIERIEPRYEIFAGNNDEAVAYILGLNVYRRHLSKGQCAMAIVHSHSAYSVRLSRPRLAEMADVGESFIDRAQLVEAYSPHLIQAVLDGGSLNDAWAEAKAEKARRTADKKALGQLYVDNPTLAARVESGSLTLNQALATAQALKQQQEDETQRKRLLAEIELAREEIGSPSPLPDNPPDVTLQFEAEDSGEFPEPEYARGSTGNELKEERDYLRRLIDARDQVLVVANETPLESVSWTDGHLNAVRSFAHSVITAAYQVVQDHEAALSKAARIREV